MAVKSADQMAGLRVATAVKLVDRLVDLKDKLVDLKAGMMVDLMGMSAGWKVGMMVDPRGVLMADSKVGHWDKKAATSADLTADQKGGC